MSTPTSPQGSRGAQAASALCLAGAALTAAAQPPEAAHAPAPPAPASAAAAAPDDARQVRLRSAALAIASVGLTAAYGRAKWWQDGLSSHFKTVDEGWFAPGTAYGGADKLGHLMFAYTGARLLSRAFEWAGNDSDRALALGLWTAVGTLMCVEIVDGHSPKWRFSRQDAFANLAGGALAWWLETSPAVDAVLDLRLQYSASTAPSGRRRSNPFDDYSGQRYLLVARASGVPVLREQPLLRYLEFSIGYGTRNFEAEYRAVAAPTRHAFYGVSLNLSQLLRDTAFRGHDRPSGVQRAAETALEFVQLPAAALQTERTIR